LSRYRLEEKAPAHVGRDDGLQPSLDSLIATRLPETVTVAERDIIGQILLERSNLEISSSRSTSERTVANQVAAIFRKLRVGSRRELASYVLGSDRAANPRGEIRALSPREGQIVVRAAAGQSNKAIANELGLSPSTVRVLLARGLRKVSIARASENARKRTPV
jgi:DNA-binding CsgD family transcriptional regulator